MAQAWVEQPDGAVFRLMYRSHNLIPEADRKVALADLFSRARSKNKGQSITGALLLHGDAFVQVLEGDETAVRALLARIAGDPRHDALAVLTEEGGQARVFARWAMARVSQDGEPDIPLIAHRDGISPAAGHPTTAEQDQLLAAMRDALRGQPHLL